MEEIDNLIERGKELGRLQERSRILTEIEKLDLPAGVWTLIRKIFNQE